MCLHSTLGTDFFLSNLLFWVDAARGGPMRIGVTATMIQHAFFLYGDPDVMTLVVHVCQAFHLSEFHRTGLALILTKLYHKAK